MGKGTTITEKQLSIRGMDESEYGFATPAARIIAVDNQGRHEWLVGRKAPLGGMVYAKEVRDDNIYTIPDKIMQIVPSSHDVLRDRALFPGTPAAVRRLEVRGAAGFAQLVKEPQSEWRLRQPVSAVADAKEVGGFLQRLYDLRIEEFVADNVSDFLGYGLQGDARQISIGNADGSTRMLIIGDDVPDQAGFVYARRADDTTVFTLPADVLQLVNAPAKRFRDAGVLTVPLATVSSISIARGEERLELAVDAETKQWGIKSPVVWEASAKAVADLIVLLNAAVITEFNVATNRLEADWMIEIGSDEAGITNRLEILPSNGSKDGLLIRRADDPAVHQINLPSLHEDIIDPLVYKDRLVWSFRPEQVDKVTLRRLPASEQTIERMEDGSFAAAGTNGLARLNEETFGRLLNKLQTVRASGYITYNPRNLEIYGLAEPLAELHIGLSGTNDLGGVLLVGRETPDGFYSMVKGRDVVFYLGRSDVNVLTADLVSEGSAAGPTRE